MKTLQISNPSMSTVKSVLEFKSESSIKLQCIADNGIGSDTKSYAIVFEAPVIDKSTTKYLKKVGEDVDLMCR